MRRNRLLLVTVLSVLLFSSLILYAEAEAAMWVQTYGGTWYDEAYSLVETSDGGYLLAGTTNSFGADGYDIWLVKTDMYGNMEWNQTYGGTGEEGAFSLVVASDGGYAIAGYTNSSGAGSYDFWLVKTDVAGNMEWNMTYGGAGEDWGSSLVVTSDGGYALAGRTDSFGSGGYDGWLVKTDVAGNMEWNMTYGGADYDSFRSLVVAYDGGYALTGSSVFGVFGPADDWLVKVDEDGSVEWKMTYTADCNCSLLVVKSDGGYGLAGSDSCNDNVLLVKVDEFGNVEWNMTYKQSGSVTVHSIVKASDGGYAIVAHTGLYAFPVGSSDVWLVKTDESGIMEWNQRYDGADLDIAFSVVETSDGGYALAGATGSTAEGYPDFWLIKIDENGVVPEAAWVVLPLLLVATMSIFISKKLLLKRS